LKDSALKGKFAENIEYFELKLQKKS